MKITTYEKKVINVDTDPEQCKTVCGFKPDDIVKKEGFRNFRIAGIANGVDDKIIRAKEATIIVAWGWYEDDEKCEAGYFYNKECGADLKKMGFRLVKNIPTISD